MEYISVSEAAQKWGVSNRRVQYFCSNGKIPGAKTLGKSWLIPEDAPRPLDGRTKKAKTAGEQTLYRFPVFIHSRAYSEELQGEEAELKKAQIFYLTGNYSKSIKIARKLTESPTVSVKIGAYSTLAYDFLLLGMYDSFKETSGALLGLISEQEQNTEDYQLIISALRYHLSWDHSLFDKINTERLSAEALDYYQSLMILKTVMSGENFDISLLDSFSVFCFHLQNQKQTPTELMVHSLLAVMNLRYGKTAEAKQHIKQACDIAIENNCLNYLSKYYTAISTSVDEYLSEKHPDFLKKVTSCAKTNIVNFQIVFKRELGYCPFEEISFKYYELVQLLANDMSDESIAEIMDISLKELNSQIEEVCKERGCTDRESLYRYAKIQLAGMLT